MLGSMMSDIIEYFWETLPIKKQGIEKVTSKEVYNLLQTCPKAVEGPFNTVRKEQFHDLRQEAGKAVPAYNAVIAAVLNMRTLTDA